MRTIAPAFAAALALASSSCSGGAAGDAGERGPEGPTGPLPQVAVGGGLSGDGSSGAPLAVAFAGNGSAASVCRSDHDHDARYLTSADADARFLQPADAAAAFAAAAHHHDASYATTAHHHDVRYRTRAELDAMFATLAPVAYSGAYDDLAGRPSLADYARLTDLAAYATQQELQGAFDDLGGQLAALPAPLRTATFTGELVNAADFTAPAGSSPVLLEYTSVSQNSDDAVFSMGADGSLTVLKAGAVSATAGFDVIVSPGQPYATIELRVNGTNRARAMAPYVGAYWSHVSATVHWTVAAGDVITASAIPDHIQAMDNGGGWSVLTVLWTGHD
jgi:hypothetical protein